MTVDLEELKQKAALKELLESRESETEEVITAFLVVQNKQGQWTAYSEFADKDLSQDRTATLDDMIGGCANVQVGAQIQQTGMATVMMMEQRAMAMQQQMLQQQEAQRALAGLDLSKLRNN